MTSDARPTPHLEAPWFDVGGDKIRLLRDGRQAFPAMLEVIAGARREILLEMYWIGDDAVGRRFRDALVERARAGVRVCVVYDAIGSLGITPAWWRPLFAERGRAVEFHSISPLDPRFGFDRVETRDHRKLLVVDGGTGTQGTRATHETTPTIGFTGGINLALPWMPPENVAPAWRDDMVQVVGDAAEELRSLFFLTWKRLTGEAPPGDAHPLRRRRDRPVWVLASRWRISRSIHREYLVRINRAHQRVDIANSYFVPDRSVRAALFRAVRRGVEVRVLVPSKSDVPVVQYAAEALFATLLDHGVRLWTLPGPMLHAKTAIIDDVFTTIGSYNLDQRSWRKNLEANLAVEDGAFARHVRRWFERDLGDATPVDARAWRARSVARRPLEWAAFALRKLW